MSEPKTFMELLQQKVEKAEKEEDISREKELAGSAAFWYGMGRQARDILSAYDNWKGDEV